MKKNKRYRDGYTLVELITVLVILSVISAIIIPSLIGFIEKTKEKRYVLETQGMRHSIELYLIDHCETEIDPMQFLMDLTSTPLDSPQNLLAGYMTVKCTKGAEVQGITTNMETLQVPGIIYLVDGYRIEVDRGKVYVSRIQGDDT